MLKTITEADLEGRGVIGQAAVPGLSVREMQESVEEIVREVVIPAFNENVTAQEAVNGQILRKDNGEEFVPAGDYQPATKKYVDEKEDAQALVNDEQERRNAEQAGINAAQALVNAQILRKDNEEEYRPTKDFQPATKKYVDDAAFKSGSVSSVFGRSGDVAAEKGDYTSDLVTVKGYVKAGEDPEIPEISDGDTVNEALGKLEARLDDCSEELAAHEADWDNPHRVTPEQIGAAAQIVRETIRLTADGWIGTPTGEISSGVLQPASVVGELHQIGSNVYKRYKLSMGVEDTYGLPVLVAFTTPEIVGAVSVEKVLLEVNFLSSGALFIVEPSPPWGSEGGELVGVELRSDPGSGGYLSASEAPEALERGTPWQQPFTPQAAVTESTQVDLFPNAAVLTQMAEDGTTAIFAENDGGAVRAVAMGEKPTADMTIQANIYSFVEAVST